MDQQPHSTLPSTKQEERMPPIRSLTEEINSLSLLSSPSPTNDDRSGPPEWMLRIMRERGGQLERGDGQIKRELKKKRKQNKDTVQLVGQSSEDLDRSEWMDQKGGREGEGEKENARGDTPKLGGGRSEEGGLSERRSQVGEQEKECTSGLLKACLSSGSDPTIVPRPTSTIYTPLEEEDPNHPLQYSSISPSPHHHEFSSASSNSSNASNYGGGFQSYTAASSSSGASSSGFSSAASASSITSASSTTTFSISSHEREREKGGLGGGQSHDRSGGGGGKSRPLSAGATELYHQQQQASTIGGGGGGGPLGLGLYRSSSTASPTLSPDENNLTPLASYPPALHHRYSSNDHSPQIFSRNPSRSSSFDLLNPSSNEASKQTSSNGRDSTLLSPSHSSPTPSTSTLAPSLPVPVPLSAPPPKSPSIKGKEKALPSTTSSEEEEEEDGLSLLLYPPENFAIVAPGIFRSSFPRKKNFRFLKESLKLKSVLTLIQDDYPQENLDFLEQEGIQLFQFPIPGNKEPFVHIPDDKIVAAMAVLLDTRNHPLLIHCNKGKHRTGCLVGTLRRLQTWSLTAIFDEYRRYSHPKSRQMDLQFIEAFKGLDKVWDLASNNRPHLPSWACTTPYSTPQRGKAPPEAKTKERSQSRAPSGRNSPVLKSLREEEDKGGGGRGGS